MSKTSRCRQRLVAATVVMLTACFLLFSGDRDVWAQSGSRTRTAPRGSGSATRSAPRPSGSQTRSVPNGSRSKTQPAQNNVALEGYCPVCVLDMRKWVRGTPEHQAQYDGNTYYFPGEEQKAQFLANPAKYVPALGSQCAVCYATMGKGMPGNIHNAQIHQGRLFLFPNADMKKEFLTRPDQYANIDLVLDGNCAVCRVEMNQKVPGNPEIAVVHQGMRYLFPSDEQRQMFLANPAKYVVQPVANNQGSGSGSR